MTAAAMPAEARIARAEEIINTLPEPDYARNYQPDYADAEALTAAVAEACGTPGVTTPRLVDAARHRLAGISLGHSAEVVVITGQCHEAVHLDERADLSSDQSIERLVSGVIINRGVIANSLLSRSFMVDRGRGQSTKPRTQDTQTIELPGTGLVTVPSFKGEAVNGREVKDRAADPTRIVAAAVQARDVEHRLRERIRDHAPAAHEALLLPYEHAFLRRDPDTGNDYLLSADIPWVGVRTNGVDSPVVDLLRQASNPVGVKIGASSTEEHIQGLSETLNPERLPGKEVYMVRLGLHEQDRYPLILEAIRRHAPGSVILYDIHGSTRPAADGKKIRSVEEIVEGIAVMSRACGAAGLRLHGVHLETTANPRASQCVERADELPAEAGDIDPNLNPYQTLAVLNGAAAHLIR